MMDVIDFADVAIIYHFFDEMKFGLKARMPGGTHKDDKIFMFGGLADEAIHLGSIYDHRLFEQEMFACLYRGHSCLEMRKGRRGDNDGIDVIIPQYVAIICGAVGDVVFFQIAGEDLLIGINQPENVCPAGLKDAIDVGAAHHTRADDAYVWFIFHFIVLIIK